jgi:hypothetical protein
MHHTDPSWRMTNAWRRLSASRASAGESSAGISGSGRSRGCHPDQLPLGAICQACHTPPSARSTTTTSRRPSAFGARAGGPTPAPLLGLPSDCHPDHSPLGVVCQACHTPPEKVSSSLAAATSAKRPSWLAPTAMSVTINMPRPPPLRWHRARVKQPSTTPLGLEPVLLLVRKGLSRPTHGRMQWRPYSSRRVGRLAGVLPRGPVCSGGMISGMTIAAPKSLGNELLGLATSRSYLETGDRGEGGGALSMTTIRARPGPGGVRSPRTGGGRVRTRCPSDRP